MRGRTESKQVIRAIRDTEEWGPESMQTEFREEKSSQWLNTAKSEMIGFPLLPPKSLVTLELSHCKGEIERQISMKEDSRYVNKAE